MKTSGKMPQLWHRSKKSEVTAGFEDNVTWSLTMDLTGAVVHETIA